MSVLRRRVLRAVPAVALVLLSAGCGPDPVMVGASGLDGFARDNGLVPLPRAQVELGTGARALTVDVLVADTAVSRARGLQGVAEVPDGIGMLFVFEGPAGPQGRPGFWMLDTIVPLDIAFVADGTVVGVATMVPCAARPCPITHPRVDYEVALELRAGALAAAGIGPGDPFVRRAARAG